MSLLPLLHFAITLRLQVKSINNVYSFSLLNHYNSNGPLRKHSLSSMDSKGHISVGCYWLTFIHLVSETKESKNQPRFFQI